MTKKQTNMVTTATVNIAVAAQNLLTTSLEEHLVVGMTILIDRVKDTSTTGLVVMVFDKLSTDLRRMRRAM